MENPIKMDDLGVPLFLETPICPASNHGYVDAILYIFMFHFQGVSKLQKRLGMWKFEEARKH